MSGRELLEDHKEESQPPFQCAGDAIFRHVLVCVDTSSFSHVALAHAAAVALAVGARLTVMRILEPSASQAPTDPVEWTLRHRDIEAELRQRASHFDNLHADAVVIDGPAAESICAWVRDNNVDLTVLGVGGESNWPFGGLGGKSRRVAEATNASVLLVPSTEVDDAPVRYRRVMTPLDGSSRSECALPIALGIAAAHDAEVVLVHAAPNIDLTETGPLEAEAIALRDRLRRRNERVAEQYLRQVRSRLPRAVSTRTRVLASGDPRHALARAAVDDHSDIIVLSATGLSGHPDLSVGSVAEYLINHVDKPILLVRGQGWTPPRVHHRCGEEAEVVRLPSRALI